LKDFSSSVPMTFAKSLRVIGQSLEIAKVSVFQLENDGQKYVVQSDSMSRTAEWILRYAVRESEFSTPTRRPPASATPLAQKPVGFSNADIARLDTREAKRRREFSQTEPSAKLSHLLRVLGDHLDKSSARTFHIFWMSEAAIVDFRRADGLTDRQRFTFEKLREFNSSACRRRLLTIKNI
jgi:hypothetical protein